MADEPKSCLQKGEIDKGSNQRLDNIGFVWTRLKDQWNNGLRETIKYKKNLGMPNAPQYFTQNGFGLGAWQNNQRVAFRTGTLSDGRIKQLDGVGFSWNLFDERWERGYRETLNFKRLNGTPNAPWSCINNGFRLGRWQIRQRRAYKEKSLSADRIKRLEKIGFVWNVRNNSDKAAKITNKQLKIKIGGKLS